MAGDGGNILMKIVAQNNHGVAGETSTLLPTGRERATMMHDFKQTEMFEIDSFNFSVNVNDDGNAPKPGAKPAAALPKGHPKPPEPSSYAAFRSNKAHKYPVAVQPITFKRLVDTTSALLFQHCVNCTSFKSATLVKLKPAGNKAAGAPYLRIDFHGVLLTKVSWSNDEPVSASHEFISRKVRIRYRPQLPDGTLGAVIEGFWNSNPGEARIT